MAHLHRSSICVHGNLTSENCVVDGRWVLKVTDFGILNAYSIYGNFPEREPEGMPYFIKASNCFPHRDSLWLAPELLRNPELLLMGTQKGDIYAAAIIIHEILCRCPPFGDSFSVEEIEEIVKQVKAGTPPFRPSVSLEKILIISAKST